MTFTLDAVAEPANVPPRVKLTADSGDPALPLSSTTFYRDGVALRFHPIITGQSAITYDYDAPFDVLMTYRADGSWVETNPSWTEIWTNTASWTGSGWTASAGVVSSTTPLAEIYRDTTTALASVALTAPSNLTVKIQTSTSVHVAALTLKADGTVQLQGNAAAMSATGTGSGGVTMTLAGGQITASGSGWSLSTTYSGTPIRVRLVAPAAFSYVTKWGSSGSGNGQFQSPFGILIDGSGNFFVVDSNNNRVQKFNSSGTYQSQFGSTGTGNGQFLNPHGIARDSATGDLYVSDSGSNDRIVKFNSSGVFQSNIGGPGIGNGQFANPHGVAVDGSGNLFVVDMDNNRVQKFNSSGVYQSQFGTAGSGNGQFNKPRGIAFDSTGNIFVVDQGNNRIQKFNSGGTYQSQFGTAGSGNGQFNTAYGIAIDSSNNIFVVDQGNNRVQKFNSAGTYVSQFGSGGTGNGQFSSPHNIAINGSGLIWVTDNGSNNRVEKFDQSVGSTDDIVTTLAGLTVIDSATDTETLAPTGANAGCWLTNTAQPDLAAIIETCDEANDPYYIVNSTREQTTLAANTVQLDIEGSADVVTVATGPRKRETWTLEVACTTEDLRDSFLTIFADDAPILLRFPPSLAHLGLDSGYYAVGDISTRREEGPVVDELATVTLPLTPARAPQFEAEWQWNLDALAQTGLTLDEVAATYATLNDLLVGPTT